MEFLLHLCLLFMYTYQVYKYHYTVLISGSDFFFFHPQQRKSNSSILDKRQYCKKIYKNCLSIFIKINVILIEIEVADEINNSKNKTKTLSINSHFFRYEGQLMVMPWFPSTNKLSTKQFPYKFKG